jgi:bifunctional NMN adenylyltransferase/nudix hydrolase
MSTYDLIAYIGRFEPFHIAHLAIVRQALSLAKYVHIVIGSSNEPATVKNPFSYVERREMISACFSAEEQARISYSANEDWIYEEGRWNLNVYTQVSNTVKAKHLNSKRVALIGYDKDASSYYIKEFPTWKFVQGESIGDISSTTIRTEWYESGELTYPDVLPQPVQDYLAANKEVFAPRISHLSALYEERKSYDALWAGTPYPVMFQTVDAFVTHTIRNHPHILLVQRSDDDLFALPGGYLEISEELVDGAKRELHEETHLDIRRFQPTATSLRFAHPRRSQKGRVITEVFPFDLDKIRANFGEISIDIRPGSDAKDVIWMPFRDLKRSNMHDDHFQIITSMHTHINQDPTKVG